MNDESYLEDEGEDGEYENRQFPTAINAEDIIETLQQFVRELSSHYTISPREMIGLGRALHVLNRYPQVTPGAWVAITLTLRGGDEEFRERRSIEVNCSEIQVSVEQSGAVWSKNVGWDHYTGREWRVSTQLDDAWDLEAFDIQELLSSFQGCDADISVSDESEPELVDESMDEDCC